MPPKASSNSSSNASAGGNSSSSHGNASISQHIKKFYGLLCDGGLNLPSFDEIQFGKITIGSKKKSSFSSMSSFQVKDAMLLRRHIEKEVARRTKTDIENFCFALKSMIEDEYFFCLCLVPLESTNEGSGTYFSSNESFFKLLLNISTIQMNIIEILFEELLNKCQDYEEEAYEQWDKNIPKLIISQMRWLDLIVDSKKLTEHLSTILQISSIEFTKELISAIPEIIDDSEHDNIVEKLDQVMQDKSEMTTCVIDALSNLNLKKEILNETIDRVLRNLNSASLSDLPVIIRFLLKSTNDDNIKSVVQGIRKDLDISSLNDQQQDNNDDENDNRMRDDDENDENTSLILSNNSKGKGKATIGGDKGNDEDEDDDIFYSTQQQKRKGKQFIENNQSSPLQCESLLVSAISTGIRHRKIIEKSFIQQILNEQDDEHSIIDLWILFIIYSIPNYRKDSEQVLKKKIKNRKIDLNLLKLSIEGHGEALEQIFLSLLELSSFLLRNTTDYQISLFGQGMYCYLFNSFKNDYNRQKIIQSLITHVGSNSKIEKDSSLDVLLSISYTKLSILRNYSSFFQVLIDSLTNLTDQQLRKVYKLFSILSFTKTLTNNNNTRTRDELMIIIRKQLSNTNFNFKKMGIIGSCTILSIIGSNFNQFNQSNNLNTSINSNNTNQQQKQQNLLNSNQQDLNNEEYEQCIELLDFSLKCCYKIPIFKTLLYDELCFVIKERNLDERLLQEIQTRLIHDFFQRFIIEKSDMKKLKSNYFDYKIQFSIENSQQYVNILPLLEKEDESIWNLFSQFRLMKIVMDKLKSDYSNFLLQSGIVLFDLDEIMQQFKHFNRKEKDLICTSLFFTINWFREVLNGFTFSSNNDNNEDDNDETNDSNNNNSEKYKYILERIENLNLLEKTLDKCLSMNLTFHLPTIGTNTTISASTTTTTTNANSTTTSLDSKKKKKKKKGDDDDDNDSHNDDDDDNNDEEDEDTTSNVKSKSSSSSEYTSLPSKRKYLSNFKIHYRELDLSVISIIKYNNNTNTSNNNADNDSNNNSLQPLQLFYIIEDLQSKLKSVIARSKTTFFTSKEKDNHYNLNRINTNDFYEILFDILPYVHKYIKIISKDSIKQSNNDEHENTNDDEYITPCFQLLIDILLKVFDHFKDDFNRIINLLLLSNVNNLIENDEENDLSNKDSEELIEIFYFSIKELVMELNIFDICYKLFELLKCIVIKSNLTKLKIDIQGIAKHLLQTPFPSVIKSESLGNLISGLISFGSWITGTNELIECLKDKLTNHKTSDDGDDEEDSQKHLDFNFPNITKSTIPICIKKIFIELSNKISNQELLEWKENQIQKNLKRIHQVISFYKLLTSLTKSEKTTPQLLQSTLMGSKLLLANFLKLIRFLGKYLKTNKEFVIKIFTNLNRANRQVQTICIDRKLALNKSLAKIIPKIKKDLESCNLKTKVILKQNGVENAITISVITDRDVTGKEASSQHFYSQLIVQSSESSTTTAATDKKRKRKNDQDDDGENEDEENEEENDENEEEQVEEKPKKKKKKKKSDEGDDEESKKKKKKKKKKDEEEEEDEEPKKKKKKKKKSANDEEDDEEDEEKPKKKKKKKKASDEGDEEDDEEDEEKPKKKKKKKKDEEEEEDEEPKKKKKKKLKHTSDDDPIEEDEEVSSKRKKKELSKKKSKNLMEDDNDPIEEHVFEESLAADSPRETTIFDDDDNAIFDDNESLTDFIAPPNNNQDDISNYDVTKSLPESRDDFMDDEAE